MAIFATELPDNLTEPRPDATTAPLRVVPYPVRRQVEDRLRRAIMDGTFPPGTHLADRLLCEQFDVSRSIIREAVRLLEAEGLVTVVPHRGPFVTSLSAAEATQVYEVRAALEALAGENFAERASDEERAELRRVYEALAAMGPDSGRQALLDIKRAFYDVLLRGCRNAYAARMLGQESQHAVARDLALRSRPVAAHGARNAPHRRRDRATRSRGRRGGLPRPRPRCRRGRAAGAAGTRAPGNGAGAGQREVALRCELIEFGPKACSPA